MTFYWNYSVRVYVIMFIIIVFLIFDKVLHEGKIFRENFIFDGISRQ